MKQLLSLLAFMALSWSVQAQTVQKVGVNTKFPSEVLHVDGTMRISKLPEKGANAIYTKPDGTVSTAPNQLFMPTTTIVANANHVLGKSQTPPSSFFYMPAVYLPTKPTDVQPPVTYNAGTGEYMLNLFNEYQAQYGLTGASVKSPTATTLPVETTSTNLTYFVTYYDNSVYEAVSVNNVGQLTYKVKAGARATAKSYMNIVLRLN